MENVMTFIEQLERDIAEVRAEYADPAEVAQIAASLEMSDEEDSE